MKKERTTQISRDENILGTTYERGEPSNSIILQSEQKNNPETKKVFLQDNRTVPLSPYNAWWRCLPYLLEYWQG